MMNTENIPIANPTVVLREEFDDWAVLFNPDTADALGVNPIGVKVWKLLDGQRDRETIQAEIREHFADVPETVEDEINAFINDLAERGFVGYEQGS